MEYPSLCDEHKRRMYRLSNRVYFREFVMNDPRFNDMSDKEKEEYIDGFDLLEEG
jgi:hypothetical protein